MMAALTTGFYFPIQRQLQTLLVQVCQKQE
jgi:hypothetical protein